ncbi:hypothetical protein BX661DRAFT_177804 [Kickxella alabastrina]|uniref:uncharacterized protein n=1 Tax=Kickxella alabastrina TaxID=61397 RepID=UPI00221F438D|nr:uncharacterized protein BX661DRAFT_177804 [Kickxella alabastrina]KAI7833916.1 hypothetical protein BX661DRAFT_177804 [Kickxella alabastrina]
MNSNLSQFQTLPLDIVNLIVLYLFPSANSRNESILVTGFHYELAAALIRCCHAWRTVIMERLCREITMECFSDGTVGDMSFKRWPKLACTPTFRITHLVKRVVVVVCTGPSADGPRAKHLISRSSQPSFFFPNAIGLKVVLPDYRDSRSVGANLTELGASEFAQNIKRMVPAVRDVAIHSIDPHYADGYDMANDHLLGRFSIDLCQSVSQVSIKWSCGVQQYDVGLEWEDGLTDRKYEDSQRDHHALFELIRRNAGTLQSLDVRLKDDQKISDLCSDDSGCAIVYPLLEKLIIYSHRDSYFSMSDADQTVAFPTLKYLIAHDYFDHADHAFKGISSTLEYLFLELSTDTVRRLEQSGIFTTNKLPKLRKLILINVGNNNVIGIPAADAMRFAIKILDTAQFVREISIPNYFDKSVFYTSIQSTTAWTSSIRLVSMWDGASFENIVLLLKHLPALRKLDCSINGQAIGTGGYDDYFDEPVDVIYQNNYPVGRCFTTWYINNNGTGCLSHIMTVIALVAIICPTFTRAFIDGSIYYHLIYRPIWKNANGDFGKYADRLQNVKYLNRRTYY